MAANVLANLIREMESRYEVMGQARARNIVELNRARAAAGEPPLPYILCVIDELADLMMVAPAEVEDSIIRLAQKSRAVGIHLVLATQRPSVDIITGTIKVNVPARIAFAVSSQHDSRVILDQGGAESLLGQGDMLFRPIGSSKLQRIQGAYITEDEVARVTDAWRAQARAGLRGGAARGPRGARGGRGGRVLARPGRPARGGDPPRRPDADRIGVDGPAPPARRLHARRPPDRHARAPRRDLRIRGLQAAPGADHRGRRVTRARRARRRSRRAGRARRRMTSRDPATPTARTSRHFRARYLVAGGAHLPGLRDR